MKLKISASVGSGARKYMEDFVHVKVLKSADGVNLKYVYLGLFDGHGGFYAAQFAKENLLREITKQRRFWSSSDSDVSAAIKEGFLSTHNKMQKEAECWPKTASGRPCTSGTTATVVIIRNKRVFVGHVGDSSAVRGIVAQSSENQHWNAELITQVS